MDPVVLVTGTPYFYAGDNPVDGTDPMGLRPAGKGVAVLLCALLGLCPSDAQVHTPTGTTTVEQPGHVNDEKDIGDQPGQESGQWPYAYLGGSLGTIGGCIISNPEVFALLLSDTIPTPSSSATDGALGAYLDVVAQQRQDEAFLNGWYAATHKAC